MNSDKLVGQEAGTRDVGEGGKQDVCNQPCAKNFGFCVIFGPWYLLSQIQLNRMESIIWALLLTIQLLEITTTKSSPKDD